MLQVACARVVGFIAGRSTGTLAPEAGLTHGFHAVPQSQGQQPRPRRRYLNSIKQLLSAHVKWAGFQKCLAPIEQKMSSGQRVALENLTSL